MDPRFQFNPFGPEAAAFDTEGPDLSGIDFNDPASFARLLQGSGMPIPTLSSPTSVRTEAQDRSTKIFASYKVLRDIIERHEAPIQRRWTKKPTKQRLAILSKAWGPKMAAMHRPDFDAFKKESPEQRNRGTKFRDSFIWPYINQEDLGTAKALPLLLNARGRHPPSAFAAADGNMMHVGRVCGAIVPIFLNEWTMILNGVTNAEEYGKLVSWDEHEDAFDWSATRKQFLPGEGLMILEAQERLLAFLVDCCKQLLHDISEADLTSDVKYPIVPQPQRKSEIEVNGFESLAVLAAEAPYRVPAEIDFERIESLLAARVSAAEDHLWALREDPSYLTETLQEIKEHRQEQVLDPKGKQHPVCTPPYANMLWSRCISTMLTQAVNELEVFSQLHKQAQELRVLQAKHAAAISPLKGLPKEYLYALLKFRYFLTRAAKGPQGRLSQSFPASPPVRQWWKRLSGSDPMAPITVQGVPNAAKTKMDRARDDLQQTLAVIWEDGRDLFLLQLPTVVDELNRLIETEPKVKEQVSAYIANTIGALSIITECMRQLEIYQPWANGFEDQAVDLQDDIDKEWADQVTKRLQPMLSAVQLHEQRLGQVSKFGDITDGRFTYPIEKRRTKENVEALRKAEANLDAFWATVDQHMHSKVGSLKGTALGRLLSQPRLLQRTPEWVEPPPKTKEAKADTAKPSEAAGPDDLDVLTKPLSAFYFSRLGPEKPDVILPLPRTKIKTKGTPANPSSAAGTVDVAADDSPDAQPTLAVDARALKVFRTLFYNPAKTSTPGEVPWTDFLHAMTYTGFLAEKLYGSVWQFRPTRLDVERPIQIHEPHPHSKIPFRIARRHGRRLNRAYGWYGSMFVLKEQEDPRHM